MKNYKDAGACILIVGLAVYVAMTFTFIDRFPEPLNDEALFMNPAYNLVAKGFFGTTLMEGFQGIERHTYWMPPVYLLLLSAVVRIVGFGWIDDRLTSATMGAVALVGAFFLSKRLFPGRAAITALTVPLLAVELLFVHAARDGRPESTLAALAVWTLYLLVIGSQTLRHDLYLCAGVTAMLGVLTHPNGAFFIPGFGIVAGLSNGKTAAPRGGFPLKRTLYFFAGMAVAGVPYAFYVFAAPSDWLNQVLANGADPSHYLQNLAAEGTRYLAWLRGTQRVSLPLMPLSVLLIMGSLLVSVILAKRDKRLWSILLPSFSFSVGLSITSNKWDVYLSAAMPLFIILLAHSLHFVAEIAPAWLSHMVIAAFLANNVVATSAAVWYHSNTIIPAELSMVRAIVQTNDVVLGDAYWWMAMPSNRYVDVESKFDKAAHSGIPILEARGSPVTLILTSPVVDEEITRTLPGGAAWHPLLERCSVRIAELPWAPTKYLEVRRVTASESCH